MPGAGAESNGVLLFNGHRVSIWDKKILEMDGSESNVNVLNISQLYT